MDVGSAVKAFFVASQKGLRYSCQGPNATGYRAANGGFEIVTETGGCGKPVERITVRVDAHGTTEEIGRITTQAETEPCPQP